MKHGKVIETFTSKSPKRFDKAKERVKVDVGTLHINVPKIPSEMFSLPQLDYEKIINEEKQQQQKKYKTKKFRVSVHRIVERFSKQNWRVFSRPDGKYSWRVVISSPGASFIRPHFKEFPSAAQVYLYGERGIETLRGPVKKSYVYQGKEFWGSTIKGKYLYIEVIQDSASVAPDLFIDKISHGYRDLRSGNTSDKFLKGQIEEKVENCHEDPNCYPGWDETCVANMYYEEDGSGYYCTGSLVMDESGSYRNWFLTAYHCISSNSVANTLVTYFNNDSNSCNGSCQDLPPPVVGATFKVGQSEYSGSDFSLLELAEAPPANVSYCGWTIDDLSPGEDVTSIHHPGGICKRISFGDQAYVPPDNDICQPNPGEDFWRVIWTAGTTEGGSSGGPLFNNSHQIVGQLNGGCADCTATNHPDYYGKFSVSWNDGLSEYLGSSPCGGDSDEPDNNSGQATTLSPGASQTHSICPVGDVDWLTFTLDCTSGVVLETSGASGNTEMWLYDGNLNEIENNDDGGTNFWSKIDRDCDTDELPPGTYYVKIDAFGGNSEIASYDILLTTVSSCILTLEICDGIDNDCDGSTDEGGDSLCDDGNVCTSNNVCLEGECVSEIDEDCCLRLSDGDVNGDGSITPQDALMTFQHYLGIIELNQCQQDHADVNNDGSITPADALCIFQKYLGLSSCLD